MNVRDQEIECIEALIRSEPGIDLAAASRERIVADLQATELPRPTAWWRVRVPLWSAAAATILTATTSAWVARSAGVNSANSPQWRAETRESSLEHTVQHTLIARSDRGTHRTDISRWQVVSTSNRSSAQ